MSKERFDIVCGAMRRKFIRRELAAYKMRTSDFDWFESKRFLQSVFIVTGNRDDIRHIAKWIEGIST